MTAKSETPTPRVDAVAGDGWSGDAECVSADFARQLERELSEAHASLAETIRIANEEMDRHKRELSQARSEALERAARVADDDWTVSGKGDQSIRIAAAIRQLEKE